MHKRLLGGLTVSLALGAAGAASAATVTGIDDTGTGFGSTVYSARAGEINRLRVDTVFLTPPFRTPLTEYSATLKLGAGCTAGTPVLCLGGGLVKVHLGDGDDVARVAPFFPDASVFAGDGNDDVFADGQTSAIDGGSGGDILRLNANGRTDADGGSGNDQIAGSGGEAANYFDGGNGDDLVVGTSPYYATIRGQDGDDALLRATGGRGYGAGTVAGNDGDDVITSLAPVDSATTFGAAIDGGRGDDVIGGPAATVDGGPGDDRIDVVGGADPSTVICGKGADTVWADASDVIGADCERVIRTDVAPTLPGVADARARAQVLLAHRAQPDPNAA